MRLSAPPLYAPRIRLSFTAGLLKKKNNVWVGEVPCRLSIDATKILLLNIELAKVLSLTKRKKKIK